MSMTVETRDHQDTAKLPGADMLRRTRDLILVAVIAAIGYWVLLAGSIGTCSGGVDAAGHYLDAAGQVTTVAPQCTNATLHGSPLVLVAIGAIVFLAIGRVLRRATDEDSARRMLRRAAVLVLAVAAGSLVISYLWFAFWASPETLLQRGMLFAPFPFGAIDIATTPMGR